MAENKKNPIAEELNRRIEYAKRAYPNGTTEKLYEVHGAIGMAFRLGAISRSEYLELESSCVRDGINNPKYFER